MMDQVILPELTIYYYCEKCHGLLPALSRDHVMNHLANCDSDVFKSSCDLFAVEKQLFLQLCTESDHYKELLTLEASTSEGEGCATNRQLEVNLSENKIKDEEQCCKESTEFCQSSDQEASVKEDRPRTASTTNVQRLRTSARRRNSGISDVKSTQSALTKQTADDNQLDECTEQKRHPVSRAFSERRVALEKKYSNYLVSAETSSRQRPERKHAKLDGYYQCPQCEWRTAHVGHFERHLHRRHDDGGLFRCPHCEFSCVDSKVFRRHKNQHDKPFVCDECNMRFTFKKDLQRHIWKHSGLKPFKCEHCDFTTRFKETITSHLRKHTGEKLCCDQEGCAFTTIHPSSLRLHKSVKHPTATSKVYQCLTCSYSTLNPGTFNEHVKRHVKQKNFYCSLCDYRGISKTEVVKHMNIHTRETQYSCDKCSYTTAHRTAFVNHMRTHSGVKPFQCSVCGYSSITKQKVLRHIMNRTPCNGANIYQRRDDLHIDLTKYQRKNTTNTFCIETVSATSGGDVRMVDGDVVTEDSVVTGTTDHSVFRGQEAEAQIINDLSFSDMAVDVTVVDDTASHCTVVTDHVLQGDIVTCLL